MKIYIIGTSGSGKTTLARLLEQKLSITHIELDEINWLSNWEQRDPEDFKKIVQAATKEESWVVCGNYRHVKGYLMDKADTIVWLDYSFPKVFLRLTLRTLKNILTKTPIAGGNQETLFMQLFTKKSIFLWAIQTHWLRRKNYMHMMQNGENKDKWVRVTNKGEYDMLLKDFKLTV